MKYLIFFAYLVPTVLFYFVLSIRNFLTRVQFPRTPESSSLTDDLQNVEDYDEVMKTSLAVFYAVALETIHRAMPATNGAALDMACGPGQYTNLMARTFDFESVTGVDLAPHMIECCKEKLKNFKDGNLGFEISDVTKLENFREDQFRLSTFMDAAHHLPTLDHVTNALSEMDRVTSRDGFVFVLDVCRLRSAAVTESYVKYEGRTNIERGLTRFQSDFHESMYAAWTYDEFATCIPSDSKRKWLHIKPIGGASVVQLVVGLPHDQGSLFIKKGLPWKKGEHPFADQFISQWTILRKILRMG